MTGPYMVVIGQHVIAYGLSYKLSQQIADRISKQARQAGQSSGNIATAKHISELA